MNAPSSSGVRKDLERRFRAAIATLGERAVDAQIEATRTSEFQPLFVLDRQIDALRFALARFVVYGHLRLDQADEEALDAAENPPRPASTARPAEKPRPAAPTAVSTATPAPPAEKPRPAPATEKPRPTPAAPAAKPRAPRAPRVPRLESFLGRASRLPPAGDAEQLLLAPAPAPALAKKPLLLGAAGLVLHKPELLEGELEEPRVVEGELLEGEVVRRPPRAELELVLGAIDQAAAGAPVRRRS